MYTYYRMAVLNELQYRANFFTSILETAISLTLTLAGLGLVFGHTEELGGWSGWQILVLVGVFYMMTGFIQTFVQPSMELFLQDVRKGTLDFTLTKPEDSQLLVSVRSVSLFSLVPVIMGAVIVYIAFARSGTMPTGNQIAGFALAIVCACIIVYSFWLMLATVAFWFVKIENILVIFQSMYSAGRWPVTIYPPVLRALLTFLVPVAFAVTVPAQALVGKGTPLALLGAVGLAAGIFVAARQFWKVGVRHYSGASA
jgi:ABC-2 type transport system permease protein